MREILFAIFQGTAITTGYAVTIIGGIWIGMAVIRGLIDVVLHQMKLMGTYLEFLKWRRHQKELAEAKAYSERLARERRESEGA